MSKDIVGIIGGSGLYRMEGVEIREEHAIDTPFGKTSDVIMEGEIDGHRVAFLPIVRRPGHRR
jgi:5'-methylthioadenosine phosphorylase